jgi:hypothetical protein
MKTVEELEALLEAATRERDELRAIIGAGGLTFSEGEVSLRARIAELAQAAESAMRERDLSLSAWEAAGMQGRTAQSAMLELARQLDEARDTIVALTTAKAEADLEIATLTAALADQTNETTRVRLEAKCEVDALTDERDELLVRVANQDAELRATREAYVGAKWTNAYRRGAEAMREACIGAACGFIMGYPGYYSSDEDRLEADLRALPIPGEP